MACMQYIAFDFETSGLPLGRRNVEVTEEVDLYTIRHFDSSASKFIQNIEKPILLEQRTQQTTQFIV